MNDLLDALLLPSPQARVAWERWRAAVQIDALSFEAQQLLPALNAQLSEFLSGDPAAGIFQGILRKVWTRNQLLLRQTCELEAALQGAGIETPLIAGPLAWSLACPAPTIRAIPYLTFLIPRRQIAAAVQVLVEAGWRALGLVPEGATMDTYAYLSFSQRDIQLYLHWRLLPADPQDALDCERDCFARVAHIRWNQHVLLTTNPEITLLQMLCGERHSDLVPWQADIALFEKDRIDWRVLSSLASRFAPAAIDRLEQLRGAQGIPDLRPPYSSAIQRKFRWHWNTYRTWSYHHEQPVSYPGFLHFLADRCDASIWQLPLIALRRALQQRQTRGGPTHEAVGKRAYRRPPC